MKKLMVFLCAMSLVFGISGIAGAAPVYITDYNDFPAYGYNTGPYQVAGAYVGCGPTTGAMILGYFQNREGYSNMLTPPTPAGADQGLATAWALHGAGYMGTQASGFGSVYNIRPGMENYVASRSPEVIGTDTHTYSVDVMIHVGPAYNANNPGTWQDPPYQGTTLYGFNQYGAFGDAWNNDATFYVQDASGNWHIDPALFRTQTMGWLAAGIPIFLTIDQDPNLAGADHWVPMVGVDDTTNYYYYFDTYDNSVHSAQIRYIYETAGEGDQAINYVRTVQLTDTITPGGNGNNHEVPEPAELLLLGNGLLGLILFRKKFRKS